MADDDIKLGTASIALHPDSLRGKYPSLTENNASFKAAMHNVQKAYALVSAINETRSAARTSVRDLATAPVYMDGGKRVKVTGIEVDLANSVAPKAKAVVTELEKSEAALANEVVRLHKTMRDKIVVAGHHGSEYRNILRGMSETKRVQDIRDAITVGDTKRLAAVFDAAPSMSGLNDETYRTLYELAMHALSPTEFAQYEVVHKAAADIGAVREAVKREAGELERVAEIPVVKAAHAARAALEKLRGIV